MNFQLFFGRILWRLNSNSVGMDIVGIGYTLVGKDERQEGSAAGAELCAAAAFKVIPGGPGVGIPAQRFMATLHLP